MQMCDENFSTFFLEMSVFRPKVNRKSFWTRDHYITNVRRMFAWSKTSHSLKKTTDVSSKSFAETLRFMVLFLFSWADMWSGFLVFLKAGRFYWYSNDVYLCYVYAFHVSSIFIIAKSFPGEVLIISSYLYMSNAWTNGDLVFPQSKNGEIYIYAFRRSLSFLKCN